MGLYINPPDMSKEDFLKKHGTPVKSEELKKGFDFSGDKLPVCLVENPGFTAAGICDFQGELDAFLSPDPRRRCWFLVPKELLKPYMHEE